MRAYVYALFPVLLLALGRCAGCVEHEIHPAAVEHCDYAVQYLNQGQCVQAEERCRLCLEYGENFANAHNCLGIVVLQCQQDIEKAKQHFKDALAVNPDFADGHNNLGTCFFRETPPNYAAACDEFLAAVEIDPTHLDGRENYGMCLMRQGTIAGDSGDIKRRTELYQQAKSQLLRLLELTPNRVNAWHHLGFMDLVDQQLEAAQGHLNRCLELDPENPFCCYNLGNVYLQMNRCDEAIEQFICALREQNDSGIAIDARKNLAVSYEMCAKKDGAIKAFLDRIRNDPGNPTHHFDLGQIYAERGLPEQAANEWENTVKLDALYCPAYFELAMYANRILDAERTIQRCLDFISCGTEVRHKDPNRSWPDKERRCKDLVKKLERE